MPDPATPGQSLAAPSPVSSTAVVGLSTAGGVVVLNWVFSCLQAGKFVMPDQTTVTFLAGALAPGLHQLAVLVRAWLAQRAERALGLQASDLNEQVVTQWLQTQATQRNQATPNKNPPSNPGAPQP